jgi:DNA polymerase/3'-5' exonuclease PolX
MGKTGTPTPLERAQMAGAAGRLLLLDEDGQVPESMVCGSVRRQRPMVSDVDVLVTVPQGVSLSTIRMVGPETTVQEARFTEKQGVAVVFGVRLEFWACPPEHRGPMMQFLTGPADFNVWLRVMAKHRGQMLSQWGLFDENGDRLDPTGIGMGWGGAERLLFEALGVPYMHPEDRDDWRWRVAGGGR